MLDVELAIQNWTDVMINRYRKTKKGNKILRFRHNPDVCASGRQGFSGRRNYMCGC